MSQNIKTFIRSGQSTKKLMYAITGALLLVALYSSFINWYYQGTVGFDAVGFYVFIKIWLNLIIATAASVAIEALYYAISKKDNEPLIKTLVKSYPIITGMFIGLIFPLGTPIWILIISTIVGVFVAKLVFGGVGYNIFNPALVALAFGILSFGDLLKHLVTVPAWYISVASVDVLAGTTPLQVFDETLNILAESQTLSTLLLGNYIGTPGETAGLLIIILGIVLSVFKVIDWRIPVSIIGTVFVMSLVYMLMLDSAAVSQNMGIWFPLTQVLSGGLLFASVFMATDPVTSPTTKSGKILYGILIGIVAYIIRMLGDYPEGILFAILLLNAFVTIMDNSVYTTQTGFTRKKISLTVLLVVLVLGLAFVTGRDNTAPEFLGAEDVTLIVNTDFSITRGVKVKDDRDGFITAEMEVVGSVDTTTVGEYEIIYTVKDSANNETTIVRTVSVVDYVPTSISSQLASFDHSVVVNSDYDRSDYYNVLTGLGVAEIYSMRDAEDNEIGIAFKITVIGSVIAGENMITYVIGFDVATDTVIGYEVLSENETDNIGSKIATDADFIAQFTGLDATTTSHTLDIISGATYSSSIIVDSILETGIDFYMVAYLGISDTTAPVISGAEDIFVGLNSTFDASTGVTAVDDTDGDVTANMTIDDTALDLTTVGEYTVTYTVSDILGNTRVINRTVYVIGFTGAASVVDETDTIGVTGYDDIDYIFTAYDGSSNVIGYVYIASTIGSSFAGSNEIVYLFEIDAATDTFIDFRVLVENETASYGGVIDESPYQDQFDGDNVDSSLVVDMIGGATQTSVAMRDSIMDNVVAHYETVIVGGGM